MPMYMNKHYWMKTACQKCNKCEMGCDFDGMCHLCQQNEKSVTMFQGSYVVLRKLHPAVYSFCDLVKVIYHRWKAYVLCLYSDVLDTLQNDTIYMV